VTESPRNLQEELVGVPQARAYVIERLGSYSRTLDAGLNTVVPFIDRVRARIDLREQVVSFAPQPVITEDNLVVHIDTVLYFQVTDRPRPSAPYSRRSTRDGQTLNCSPTSTCRHCPR
jgi:regulator of protease activity HflC (stomatin/prohibitin superfamily)